MIESLLFWLCCAMVLVGALGAALVRNVFHAALLLGLCLLGVAGLYLFLEQPWLACVQVIVYIGGVLVLILFATLFSADAMGTEQRRRVTTLVIGSGAGALALVLAWRMATVGMQNGVGLQPTRSEPGMVPDAMAGSTNTVGDLLVGDWFVPFLAAGLLLTVALVGAVITVQRFRVRAEAERA